MAALTHQQLLELAADLATASEDSARRAEKHLAKHLPPLAEWAVSKVLLSSDLLPSLFLTLAVADAAASRACKAWRACWKATLVPRRILHPAPPLPLPKVQGSILDMLAIDDKRLAISTVHGVSIVDTRMQRLPGVPVLAGAAFSAVSADSLFTSDLSSLRRYRRDTLALAAENDEFEAYELAAAGGMLLGLTESGSLAAFDATTLEHRFDGGAGVFECIPGGLAVHGNELYVCALRPSPAISPDPRGYAPISYDLFRARPISQLRLRAEPSTDLPLTPSTGFDQVRLRAGPAPHQGLLLHGRVRAHDPRRVLASLAHLLHRRSHVTTLEDASNHPRPSTLTLHADLPR